MTIGRLYAAGALLALAACNNKSKLDDLGAASSAAAGATAGSGKKSADEPPKRDAVTPKKIAPLIHELGDERAVPTSLVIELAKPIVDRDHVGEVSAHSQIKITPETAGTLTYSGESELTFTPFKPFHFNTDYKIELEKIETRDGVLAPATGESWSYAFHTPKFAVLGWAPTQLDAARHKVTMEITFSGAVLPNIARAAMTFTVAGQATNAVAMLPHRTPNVIAVQFTDPHLEVGAKIGVTSTKALVALDGTHAPEASLSFDVTNQEAVSIKAAKLVEGGNGFYVEVVCDDAAAAPGHRSYYEDEGYYDLSARCQLDDDALSKIHFKPAVKKLYIASSRAGFRIFGDFKRGTYAMHIDPGARSVDGGLVLAPFARSFAVPARRAQLSFAASGRYLPRSAWDNLGLKHVNVDAVNVVVRRVPPENLIFWLGADQTDAADERTSDVILKKTVQLQGEADASTTSWLDVASLLPSTTKGVLELKLVGVGAQATSRLLLTDMSLVAKKTTPPGKPWDQTVQVWALGMESADTLDGVDVSLVRKSGKVVARCSTSGNAGCKLAVNADDDPDQGEPFALIARKGDDLTYIRYSDLRADVAESSTSGIPFAVETPYRAALWSDRGVYRPGDSAHVVAVVRDFRDHAPSTALPVDVKVIDPRAKVVRKQAMKPNEAGVIAFDQAFPAFADTGHWRVELAVADKPLGSYDLQVEEFVPERMKVTATPKKPDMLIGTDVAIDVTATYLFGGNAMDSGIELNCSIEPSRFHPKENSDLTYGVEPKGKAVSLGETRAQIDIKGHALVQCPEQDESTASTQTGELTATAAVLEAGSGRATVKSTTVTLHPEKFYLGVKTTANRASPGETFSVDGMVVDWNGRPLPSAIDKIQIELVHLEADYGYGYDDATGEQRWDRWTRAVPEGKQMATVSGGKFHFDVTPNETDAGYVVRVKAGKAKTELVLQGDYGYEYYGYEDGYRSGYRADATPRPARPTQLALDLPKQIEVGKPVSVKAKSPYKGKVLWTVETDHVIKSEWLDVTGGDLMWSFTLDAFAPNVYVTAFVVKDPHLESKAAFLPDRAFGITSAKVRPTEFTQTVTMSAPKEVRSSSPLNITLDVGKPDGPTFATVAVVDEGILQLTNFATPDPLAQLFTKRALGVETFETIGWTMLHQPASASSRTGGGDDGPEAEEAAGGAGSKGRVQPVHPVALWSGIVPVGVDGKVTIPFHIPQYRGQVRVMAITESPTRIGRAEADVVVRDPLVVQVTFPRFVTQNDELEIPVFLTNMSTAPFNVNVKLDADAMPVPGMVMPKATIAPLSIKKDTGSVHIDPGHSETLVFRVKANIPAGAAKLRVTASAGSLVAKDELDVPFLPAGPRERVVQKIKIDPGTTIDLSKQTALKGWVPTSEQTTFWLTSNPYGESFSHLSYLIHYPYGCIEQTTSSTRPLLYIANIVEQVDPQLAELRIEDMVLSGIQRVFSMQTPSGGFAYWPGGTEPYDWATAYATHMLLDAKKAGYAVPDDRLREVLTWIDHRTAELEKGDRVTADPYHGEYNAQSEAYLHYVLAIAGKGKKARILTLISALKSVKTGAVEEEAYMLKAALYVAGDRRYEKDLKTLDTAPIVKERINYWSFYSDLRRRGLELSIFQDLFGADPAGELAAQRVAEGLSDQPSYWYTTQELVWGVTGLGKRIGATTRGAASGKLVAEGSELASRRVKTKSNDKTWSLVRASEYKTLTLEVPASASPTWLVINANGVRAGGDYKTGGNGLSVSRTYRNLAGDEIDPSKGTLTLGDLVFVELEVGNTSGVSVQNIALVDRLPAGFEIENPRLGRSTKPEWVKDDEAWAVDFMNMRDDRIEAFGALGGKQTRKIVYTVRVVTSGKFTIPPVEAEAMYDPTLWARDAGGSAVVAGPWAGRTL